MACSNERESATDASTASQSIAFGDERFFPNAPDAFLATTCSTNLRTRSNDPMSKESVEEADPSRSASQEARTRRVRSSTDSDLLWTFDVEKAARVVEW